MYETRIMRWLRWKHHISQLELARCADVSRQRIVQIELAEEHTTKANLHLVQKGFTKLIERREAELQRLKEDTNRYINQLLSYMDTKQERNEGDAD